MRPDGETRAGRLLEGAAARAVDDVTRLPPLGTGSEAAPDPAAARRRANDTDRRRRNPWRRLYSTKAWKEARAAQKAKMPWCERCWAAGILTPMTVVNHRIPHRGDERLFFDPANHESTCEAHHNRDIQREERRPAYATEDDARRAYLLRRRRLLKAKGFGI